MTWELVGRADELERGADALATHRLVAFTGAPGVGKSRLLAEVVTRFEVGSRPVFRALATEATRTLPLSPFVPLLPAAPPADPSLLLAALVDAIEVAGGEHGLLLVVDDAHHLDDGSLALLAVATASSHARIALTTSHDHEPPPGLASLLRDDRAIRLDVGPLSRADVVTLVDQALGRRAGDDLHDELWRLSQGNPMVLRETLAGAADRLEDLDHLEDLADPLISTRLTDLARRRIDALEADTADALTLVAAGAPAPYGLLAAALPADVLDRLLASPVTEVTEVAGGARLVRPAHPLYGEVLLAGLGEQALNRTHRRLVDAAMAGDTEIDPLRVALWQHRAGDPLDPELALAGARAALARHDGALAAELLEPVHDLVDPGTAALLLGASLAQRGRHEEADDTFSTGAAAVSSKAAVAAAHPLRVELASAQAFNQAFGLRRPDAADATLAAAIDQLDDPVAHGRLDAERGVIAGIGGDFAGALAAARRTVENPSAEGPALASAYVSLTLAETMLVQLVDLRTHVRAGLDAARTCSAALPLARDQLLVTEADASLMGGDLPHADEIIEAQLARGPGLTRGLWLVTAAHAAIHAGRLADAVEQTTAALEHPELRDQFDLVGLAIGCRAMAVGQSGRTDGIEEVEAARTRHAEPRNAVWLDRGRAWLLAAQGDHQGATAQAVDAGRHAIGGDHLGWGTLALHDAVRMAEGAEIASVAAEIAQVVDTSEGAHLLEALAAHGQALATEDPKALVAAAATFAELASPSMASDAAAQAAALAHRDEDAVLAQQATALSMAWQDRCQGTATPAIRRRPPSALSARALEIALDAAAGDTSAEIAARRFLSVRTVDNHLGAAYRALQVSGRVELAAVLAPVSPAPLNPPRDPPRS